MYIYCKLTTVYCKAVQSYLLLNHQDVLYAIQASFIIVLSLMCTQKVIFLKKEKTI